MQAKSAQAIRSAAIYEVVPTGKPDGSARVATRRHPPRVPALRQRTGLREAALQLPGQTTSKLIERAVQRSLMPAGGTPKGDMAFAVAVAAYGQKLRGDPMLAGYDWTRVAALAGEQGEYSRSEFVEAGQPCRIARAGPEEYTPPLSAFAFARGKALRTSGKAEDWR